jgi:hypothetical protein
MEDMSTTSDQKIYFKLQEQYDKNNKVAMDLLKPMIFNIHANCARSTSKTACANAEKL